jgi:hypothetical protein
LSKKKKFFFLQIKRKIIKLNIKRNEYLILVNKWINSESRIRLS